MFHFLLLVKNGTLGVDKYSPGNKLRTIIKLGFIIHAILFEYLLIVPVSGRLSFIDFSRTYVWTIADFQRQSVIVIQHVPYLNYSHAMFHFLLVAKKETRPSNLSRFWCTTEEWNISQQLLSGRTRISPNANYSRARIFNSAFF